MFEIGISWEATLYGDYQADSSILGGELQSVNNGDEPAF